MWAFCMTYCNELVKSEVKGIVPHKIALTSETSHKFGGQEATLNSDQLAANSGVLTTLLGSIIG